MVREEYDPVARGVSGSCAAGCCGARPENSLALGYTAAELGAVPEGANLGLGCGNPHQIASLKVGERVVDLGCGGGFDCFLAGAKVGETGSVIGIDMTPSMIERARGNASRAGIANVEFRLGEIEHLPLADGSVDVILSNCVINLSPDKASVFREAYRVLAVGGRLAISDVVAERALPPEISREKGTLSGCLAGAAPVGELETYLREAGFADVTIETEPGSKTFIREWFPDLGAEEYVVSARITAVKTASAPIQKKAQETGCCAPSCCAPEKA